LLGTDEPGVRAAAAAALGKIGDQRAVGPLLGALNAKTWEATVPAIQALGEIGGGRALDALRNALGDERAYVRVGAANALKGNSDDATVELLIKALADKELEVRVAAAEALGEARHPKVVPALAAVLTDWELGPNAAEQLAKRKWRPASKEQEAHFNVAKRDKDALTDDWKSAYGVLTADIASAGGRRMKNAALALVAVGDDDTLDELTKLLDDKLDPDIAYTFAKCGNKELSKAAKEWLKKRGHAVGAARGTYVRWGSM